MIWSGGKVSGLGQLGHPPPSVSGQIRSVSNSLKKKLSETINQWSMSLRVNPRLQISDKISRVLLLPPHPPFMSDNLDLYTSLFQLSPHYISKRNWKKLGFCPSKGGMSVVIKNLPKQYKGRRELSRLGKIPNFYHFFSIQNFVPHMGVNLMSIRACYQIPTQFFSIEFHCQQDGHCSGILTKMESSKPLAPVWF